MLQRFGDYAQAVNPLLAFYEAKNTPHFSSLYSQSFAFTQATKFTGENKKWLVSKRPKSSKYDGMISGHTASAWFAASYIRTFEPQKRYLIIPLYASAIITGYSRVKSRKHTLAQVIGGAFAAEAVNFFNIQKSQNTPYHLFLRNSSSTPLLNIGLKF